MITIQIEVGPGNVIPLSVPDEQFVLAADAQAIAHEIPGNNVVGSMLTSAESLVSTDPNDKRGWLEITFDTTRWPNAKFPEPAFQVLQMKKAMVAAGKAYVWKDGADGYPSAVEVPPAVVSRPPATYPPGTFGGPGIGDGSQSIPTWMKQINAIYAVLVPGGPLRQ